MYFLFRDLFLEKHFLLLITNINLIKSNSNIKIYILLIKSTAVYKN